MPNHRTAANKLKTVELFAGVGGFRIGLDRASDTATGFETVWANQWEPASGTNQHAAWVYNYSFFRSRGITDEAFIKERLSNVDINIIVDDTERLDKIPDHDVLTGGFPCQDYSVARPRSQAAGLVGKKGVLWWSIHKILKRKLETKKPVKYVFLENVDRLIKSPTGNRGRDFAIILSCLHNLGYAVEWRVINAGDYGFPQRRRRIFILGYLNGSPIEKQLRKSRSADAWATHNGLLATAFPARPVEGLAGSFRLQDDPVNITEAFDSSSEQMGWIDSKSPFQNCGTVINGRVFTQKMIPTFGGEPASLGQITKQTKAKDVPEKFLIPEEEESKWMKEKEAHDFIRTSRSGHTYRYKEGALPFPDDLGRPSRTIITSEGGRSPSRFKHVVKTRRTIKGKRYKYRRLTPEELEALCMFPREHTKWMKVPGKDKPVEVPDTRRAFFMGNALVVGVIEAIGKELLRRHVASKRPRLITEKKAHKRKAAFA